MKIIRNLSILFFVFVLIIVPCHVADATSTEDKETGIQIHDYKDIPGITQEEISSVEKLLASKESFTFGAHYSIGAFYKSEGELGGFYSLLCERLGSLFDVPFQLEVFSQDDLYSYFEEGEIDFTGEIIPEDKQDSIFSTNLGINRMIWIYETKEHASLQQIDAKRIERVGYLRGSHIKDILKEADEDLKLIEVADAQDVFVMLQNNEIDAFCDWDFSRISYGKNSDIFSNEFLPLCLEPMYISTATQEYEALISVITKYVENGGEQEIINLFEDGEQEYKRDNLYTHLSKKEQTYLDENADTLIPFVASYDNYPICFYNETEEEYQGISIDVLNEITKITGLEFEVLNEVGTPWKDLVEKLERGEAAFATELIYTTERGKFFIWPETSYATDDYILISRVEQTDITVDQIPQYRIGVIAGTGYTNEFDKWFPNIEKRTEFTTYAEAFDALTEGYVDFIMGTQNLLIYNANYLEKTGVRANVFFDYSYESAFGFHPDQKELCDIFSQAQQNINVGKITQSWSLRGYDYQGKIEEAKEKARNTYYLLGGIILVTIAFSITALFIKRKKTTEKQNFILEKTVLQRTAELEQQTKAAKESSKAKSDFLARMSHEIRTPLNAILGLSRVAKNASEPGTKAHSSITEVIIAAKHLLGILNDVLDMTKIEAGKLILEVQPFKFKDAMYEIVSIIKDSCQEKSIQFENNIDMLPNICVEGDRMRLNQVLINLLSNAVKFSKKGGKVLFNLDCELRDAEQKAEILFTVIDNGIGVSKEQLSKIYGAFEQADASIATNFGGVGLGLSISQNLVQMMGGTISVQSVVDEGSTFSFSLSLPLLEEIKEENEELDFVDLSGKRILIAEDVAINRVILCECLADTSAEVFEAENGQLAFEQFEKSPNGYFDLILMDIQMPVLDGYGATEKIRALDREDAKSVPIIAVTANAYKEDIDRAMQAGMNRHLAKPIDVSKLMQTLGEVLL